jgi:hypothetical protein
MLSTKQTKEILNDPSISDNEADRIREDGLIFAEIVFQRWLEDIRAQRNKEKEGPP